MDKYIGVPFVDGGRTLEGADCYGLLKLFYKNEYNIEIPEIRILPNQPRRAWARFLVEISEIWEETLDRKKGVVVVMAMDENHPKLVTHFGVMIDDKRVLHTLSKTESHIIELRDSRVKPFIKGYYRWCY